MRRLILIGAIGLALPAFAAEDTAPAVKNPAAEAATAVEEPAAAGDKSAPTSASDPATKMGKADAAPAVEPETADAAAEPTLPPLSPDAVARGTFATAIDQREPVDSITSLESDRDRVYYFSEFVGSGGRRVTHRWEYAGEVVAEVPIAIGGPRWRAYSSKKLDSRWLGEWTVSVVDETGHVVHTDSFVYEAAAPEPEVAEVAEPSKNPATDAAPADEEPASSPAAPAPGGAPEDARAGSATTEP